MILFRRMILFAKTGMMWPLPPHSLCDPRSHRVACLHVCYLQVSQLMKKLWVLADWQAQLRQACDVSLLFWHKELLPTFLSEIYADPLEASR